MWTSGGEGDVPGQISGSRTKAGGAKAIRDRCSSGSKLCRHSFIYSRTKAKASVRALGIVCLQE